MSIKTFNIGSLSKQTGCNIETIRYYERIGLIPPPPRSSGGYRIYDEQHLKRLTFICRCRELGFTQKHITKLLSLVDGGAYTCNEIEQLVLEQLDQMQDKIKHLKVIEKALKGMATECAKGSTPDCPAIDMLFRTLNPNQ